MAMPSDMGKKADSDSDKADKNGDADKADKADDKKDSKKKDEKAAAQEDAMPKRTLKDVLTTSGALFVFSFTASDVHQQAEEKCAKESKDDPKKKADCMT